jgi:hypothetical protein
MSGPWALRQLRRRALPLTLDAPRLLKPPPGKGNGQFSSSMANDLALSIHSVAVNFGNSAGLAMD